MKIKFLFLALILVFVANAQTEQGITPKGTKFTYIKKGEKAPVDSLISFFNIDLKTKSNQSVLDDFLPIKIMPFPVKVRKTSESTDEIMAVFSMLKIGDSVFFKLPIKDFFKKIPKSAPLSADSIINVSIGFVMQTTDEKAKEIVMARQKQLQAEQAKKDIQIIDKYLSENNINAIKTESGLRYVITKEGTGEYPTSNSEVKVHYTGKLLDGKVFDTSVQSVAINNGLFQDGRNYDEPFSFTLNGNQVIAGWDEGIALLKKGGKATLYLPSNLAYGQRGAGSTIKPNTILIFDVELIDFE